MFFDDGTLDTETRDQAMRVFPGAKIHCAAAIEERLNLRLPSASFPTLRAHRTAYIHLRKLTDVHAGHHGWRAVLDSDQLFFREPTRLFDWLTSPHRPIHLIDVHDSYGYSAEVLATLAGRAVPPRVNVGVCGLQSDALDWRQLETWCAELLEKHGSSYYLEQALIALWLSGGETTPMPASDYRVMPDEQECRAPQAVMHHYVDTSKRGYFRHAWRRALPTSQARIAA